MQTRSNSFFEATMNVVIGFAINAAIVFVVFELVPGDDTDQAFIAIIVGLIVAILRNYVIRRFFNRHSSGD